MKTSLKFIFLIAVMILLCLALCSCAGVEMQNTTGGVVDNSDTTEEIPIGKESEETTVKDIIENTTEAIENDVWYVKEGSVQTEFELGERFNYKNIVVIHSLNGEITEYPEDDVYIDIEPVLDRIGEYKVLLEVLSEEITLTYTISVKDIDVNGALSSSPTITIDGNGAYRCEIEDIDLSHIKTNGNLIVDDIYASGEKYVQNYGTVGNCFGFKIISKDEIFGAKLVIRMANFSVTMIYPAKNIAIYQNYINANENTKLALDKDYYLTTRAPSMSGQEGADTSLVWCEVVIENITLKAGENNISFVVIGKEAPFLDFAEIVIP